MRGNVHLEKMGKRAEKWGGGGGGRIGCMSRVNGEMEVDRGRLMWELLAKSGLEHGCQVWWTRRKAACKNNVKKIQENIGRKLVGRSSKVAGVAVREDLG